MERTPHWYSVIRFQPNHVRGETINVGVIMHNPSDGTVTRFILDVSNIKLRGFLSNQSKIENYKVQKDFIEYYLNNLDKDHDLLTPNKTEEGFLLKIDEIFPNDFRLSEPTFALTGQPKLLFDQLLNNYIGTEFLKRNHNSQVTTKSYVKKYFDDRKLIDRKIKSNIKYNPLKKVDSMQLTIDFAYKNGILNLMQTVPSSKEQFTHWFTKMTTLTKILMEEELGFYFLYDSTDELNRDKTISQTMDFFRSSDQRIKGLDIQSNDFNMFCNKIEVEGKNIDEFETDLLLLIGA